MVVSSTLKNGRWARCRRRRCAPAIGHHGVIDSSAMQVLARVNHAVCPALASAAPAASRWTRIPGRAFTAARAAVPKSHDSAHFEPVRTFLSVFSIEGSDSH